MELLFEYNRDVYKYKDGKIYFKSGGCDEMLCAVLLEMGQTDADNIVESSDTDQQIAILKALVHAYFIGLNNGKAAKVKEFKRVFNLE